METFCLLNPHVPERNLPEDVSEEIQKSQNNVQDLSEGGQDSQREPGEGDIDI